MGAGAAPVPAGQPRRRGGRAGRAAGARGRQQQRTAAAAYLGEKHKQVWVLGLTQTRPNKVYF